MTDDVTPRFGFPYLYAGQAQKEVFHNEALILADLLVQAYAKSADQMVPPQTPAPGECWIVGDAPSGDWAGWAGALACWTHGGWRFVSPRPGMRVRVEDQGLDYFYDAGDWIKGALRPDGIYLNGVRIAGERQSGIAIPESGAVVDNEARTAILAILNALRNHGLIEGSD
jgi:hypothetical protein